MKTAVLVLLLFLLPGLGLGGPVDLKIIANASVSAKEISLDDLRAIFLGVKSSLKGTGQLKPVLVNSAPTIDILASQYLGKTESGLETYYRSLVFSGRWAMPRSFKSDAEAAAYVAKTPGAIACVQDSVPLMGAKTLALIQ